MPSATPLPYSNPNEALIHRRIPKGTGMGPGEIIGASQAVKYIVRTAGTLRYRLHAKTSGAATLSVAPLSPDATAAYTTAGAIPANVLLTAATENIMTVDPSFGYNYYEITITDTSAAPNTVAYVDFVPHSTK